MLEWFSKLFRRQSQTSETTQRKEHLERLILAHQRRLQKLKDRQTTPQAEGYLPAHVILEIEDLETEIQRLQVQLEDDHCENRAEVEAGLKARQRRLQVLRQTEAREKQGNYEQEIEAIEAQIQQLETELEQLSR